MFEGRRPDSNEVWAIDADAYVVRRLVDGLELLAWIIAGAEAHLTRTRSPASADPPNRLWPVTDAFEHTVHRPGRRGNELWSRTRTERRGNHRPGWEGVALWSFVRSISRAKGRKIIGTSATDRDADP